MVGRVVELFAGVGGFRLGLERTLQGFDPRHGWSWVTPDHQQWDVVWANQWEPSTRQQPAFECYSRNFSEGTHVNVDVEALLDWSLDGDDTALREHAAEVARGGTDAAQLVNDWKTQVLPEEFDLLVGGFPCQDYSVAKPLSQANGIEGQRGVLWWQIHRVLDRRRPPYVLLENVDRLLKSPSTQRGRDFAVMLACFARLGYRVEWRVVNAADYGYPQRRRRVFIYAELDEPARGGGPSDAPSRQRAPARAEAWAHDVVRDTGVLARALPCLPAGTGVVVDLGADDPDPFEVSSNFGRRTRGAASRSPFLAAGAMAEGVVWTTDVRPAREPADPLSLGDVLLPIEDVVEAAPEVLIPASQLDFSEEPARSSWNYLKGAKREQRTKPNGFSYYYTEGAVAFPEPLDQPARTVLTGEGGRSPSRFKLVVKQSVQEGLLEQSQPLRDAALPDGDGTSYEVFRRLTSRELERLDMFPDDWTRFVADGKEMSAGRRAFCIGNALVVGLISDIGGEIARRRADAADGGGEQRAEGTDSASTRRATDDVA